MRERHKSGSELRGRGRGRIPGRSWAEGTSGRSLPRVKRGRICDAHDKRAKRLITKVRGMKAMVKTGVLVA